MTFDPQEHHRRSIRLWGYSYAEAGAYFVTIATQGRECLFAEIVDGEMRLSEIGKVVEECWRAIPRHFPNVTLDAFIVMPNHVHGIIIIDAGRGEAFASECRATPVNLRENTSPLHLPHGTHRGSLGAIVQNFKSISARKINQMAGTVGFRLWQRNYYEHIIRNEKSLEEIRQYIIENPLRWAEDKENPVNG
jgi:REP element-mobilizing transposase RayT